LVVASKTKKRQRKRARVPPSQSRRTTAAHARPAAAPRPRAKQHAVHRVGVTSPRRLYAYAVGAAVVAATVLIGLSQISAHRSTQGSAAQLEPAAGVAGSAETAALLDGIPQHGNVLGSSKAPVRLIEYADPQCPYCAEYALNVMPTLIRDYVRPGKVQLVFRGLGFLGQDSGTALATTTAAGLQNRFWNVLDLLYRNQGPENSGWVTDSLLRSIVTAAGANADRVFAARGSTRVSSTIKTWSTLAQNAGVNSVPNFSYGRRGEPLNSLTLSAIAVPEFRAALDRALKQ
jgi:protein-disulfide isomerase